MILKLSISLDKNGQHWTMATKTTAVSCVGNADLKLALKRLAQSKNMSVGELVRSALDEVYGADLNRMLLFFTEIDQRIGQLEAKMDRTEEVLVP